MNCHKQEIKSKRSRAYDLRCLQAPGLTYVVCVYATIQPSFELQEKACQLTGHDVSASTNDPTSCAAVDSPCTIKSQLTGSELTSSIFRHALLKIVQCLSKYRAGEITNHVIHNPVVRFCISKQRSLK